LTSTAIDVRPCIHWMRENISHRGQTRTPPVKPSLARSTFDPDLYLFLMTLKPAEHPGHRTYSSELFKDQPDHCLRLLVRIWPNIAVSFTYVADRDFAHQFTAAGLMQCALQHPLFENV